MAGLVRPRGRSLRLAARAGAIAVGIFCFEECRQIAIRFLEAELRQAIVICFDLERRKTLVATDALTEWALGSLQPSAAQYGSGLYVEQVARKAQHQTWAQPANPKGCVDWSAEVVAEMPCARSGPCGAAR